MIESNVGPWRKSSYSDHSGECVEVAPTHTTTDVRDSKDPGIGRLAFPPASWSALTDALRLDA
ncbi:DUF397 domain-containing protein [Embleya sp. NPDC050154]|uniref:DUF397 domain-containing protein n=1 Tax=Embleya sp. NPDC050154 TaxID=3363988 RepID=UPI0037ABA26A